MSLLEDENQRLCVGHVQYMDADKAFKDPSGCRVLNRLSHLIRNGPFFLSQLLTNAIFQGRIPQETQGHDHQQRFDTFRLLDKERSRQKGGTLEELESSLVLGLPFIERQDFLGRQTRGIKIVGGQDEHTQLLLHFSDVADRIRQVPYEAIDHLLHWRLGRGLSSVRVFCHRVGCEVEHLAICERSLQFLARFERIFSTGKLPALQLLKLLVFFLRVPANLLDQGRSE